MILHTHAHARTRTYNYTYVCVRLHLQRVIHVLEVLLTYNLLIINSPLLSVGFWFFGGEFCFFVLGFLGGFSLFVLSKFRCCLLLKGYFKTCSPAQQVSSCLILSPFPSPRKFLICTFKRSSWFVLSWQTLHPMTGDGGYS